MNGLVVDIVEVVLKALEVCDFRRMELVGGEARWGVEGGVRLHV